MQVTNNPTFIAGLRLPILVIANLQLPIADLNMNDAMLTDTQLCCTEGGEYIANWQSEIGNRQCQSVTTPLMYPGV